MGVKISKTEIEGVLIIEPDYFYDYRGYYCETFSLRSLKQAGFVNNRDFVQDSQSFTIHKGTVRGIHFQINPKPQGKLVRCTKGKVFDVVVDLRKDSPTFKKWIGFELSEDNKKQIWIPEWCGHAFMTLEDNVIFQYKVDQLYEPEFDRGIRYDDPDIGITWPISNPIISEKDLKAPFLKKSDVNYSMKDNK